MNNFLADIESFRNECAAVRHLLTSECNRDGDLKAAAAAENAREGAERAAHRAARADEELKETEERVKAAEARWVAAVSDHKAAARRLTQDLEASNEPQSTSDPTKVEVGQTREDCDGPMEVLAVHKHRVWISQNGKYPVHTLEYIASLPFVDADGGEEMPKDVWTVRISFYSLAEGEVGSPLNLPPVVRTYGCPINAMLSLEQAIDSDEGRKTHPDVKWLAARYVIVRPDGTEAPLCSIYKEIFREVPVFPDFPDDNIEFPMLRKAAANMLTPTNKRILDRIEVIFGRKNTLTPGEKGKNEL